MPFVTTNGIDMYYEVHGQGPALVFAHPGGGNHLSWWQQVPVFAQTFACITFLYQQITAWNVRRPVNLGAQLELVHRVEPIVEQQIPTLFLTGAEDSLIPPRLVEQVARLLPQAHLVQVLGTGHSVYFEKPDEFNRLVLGFLQQWVR